MWYQAWRQAKWEDNIPQSPIEDSHWSLFVLYFIHRNLRQYNSFLSKQAVFPSGHRNITQLSPWHAYGPRSSLPPLPRTLGASSARGVRSESWPPLCLFIAQGQEETKQLWSLLRSCSYDIKGDLATWASIYSTSFQTGANPSLQGWSTGLWIAVCGNREKFRPSEVIHYPYLEYSISYSLPVGSVSGCYLAEGKRDFSEKQFLLLFASKCF